MVALMGLGFFTGMFAVPLQVFLQSRPPRELRGRMIATQNLLNWIGIMLSAVIYSLLGKLAVAGNWPQSSVFAMTALLMVPIVLLYRPADEA
jgi:acyl-[acyl-carrier-protein]-phospholipid O-acyltransferase/long-chain-fatty-acid--[acyl-carrier-protein] ligase